MFRGLNLFDKKCKICGFDVKKDSSYTVVDDEYFCSVCAEKLMKSKQEHNNRFIISDSMGFKCYDCLNKKSYDCVDDFVEIVGLLNKLNDENILLKKKLL